MVSTAPYRFPPQADVCDLLQFGKTDSLFIKESCNKHKQKNKPTVSYNKYIK